MTSLRLHIQDSITNNCLYLMAPCRRGTKFIIATQNKKCPQNNMEATTKKQLAFWLIIALIIIYVQVIIGGITRLTESGLSITRWDLVSGTLPPMSETAWNEQFTLYQQSPQYAKINKGMSLNEFKFIFFWEWLHRFWGRWGGLFLVTVFAWFMIRKKLDSNIRKHLIIILLLYAFQGVLGWFMVKSGLVDMPRVSHYRLTAHLLTALTLFAYILWLVSGLLLAPQQKVQDKATYDDLRWLIPLIILQIAYGGFMSGLRAALYFPSFPDYNGNFTPVNLWALKPFHLNFFENIATVQFIHRTLAYFLVIYVIQLWLKIRRIITENPYLHPTNNLLLVLIALQVTLGISILLLSAQGIPVLWGVLHQAVGLAVLSTTLFLFFQYRKTT